MCGIIGCIGKDDDLVKTVISGLQRLEYRGYDSAGIAVYTNNGIVVKKSIGKIAELRKIIDFTLEGYMAIGHTRWATHGGVTTYNCHPHMSMDKSVILVHNGVINNFFQLREEMKRKGFTFYSETDTEVIANLMSQYYNETKDMIKAINLTMKDLNGSFALAIILKDDPDHLYFAKRKAPLFLGKSDGFSFIASDITAGSTFGKEFVNLDDGDYGMMSKNGIFLYHDDKSKKVDYFTYDVPLEDIEKGLYPHYMVKEINEEPLVIRKIIKQYLTLDGRVNFDKKIIESLKSCDKIVIIACGTSYHAGLVGKYMIEELAKKMVEVHLGSEYAYKLPLLTPNPAVILISQSGETADLIKCLDLIKKTNIPVFTISNVETSTLARQTDGFINLLAGPEIAVASTKAYVAQLAILAIIAHLLSDTVDDLTTKFNRVIDSIEDILKKDEYMEKIVKNKIVHSRNCFYIGRGIDSMACLEAALKMKEISYIQCEGFAGGELKHGTIALIEDKVPVIAIITQVDTEREIRTNLQEVIARGALTIIISMESCSKKDDDIIFKDVDPELTPLVSVVIAQYFAYYAALLKDRDIDKPRNLAKCVTVE